MQNETKILGPDGRQLATIWDRDGTMASCHNGPKKNTAQKGSKEDNDNWAAFNAAMVLDAVVPQVAALLHSVRPGVARIMVSGRAAGDKKGETFRFWQMWMWIHKHQLPIDLLFMRAAGDKRVDSEVKHEILHCDILPKFQPMVAVDDRFEVLQVWRDHDIFTIAVKNPGTLPPIAYQTPWE